MAITLDGTNGILSPDFEPSSSTTPTNGLFLPAANTVGLATGSTERLRIDSSGNLGLGVTPNAWRSGERAVDVGAYASVSSFSNYVNLGNNYYTNSSNQNIYKNTAAASVYYQSGGQHVWLTAPSGTAGAAISFTQAMTLGASGYLSVGSTTNTSRLYIAGTSNTAAATIQVVGDGVSTLLLGQNSDGGVVRGQGGNNALTFWTGGSGDTGAGQSGTERARIDSSGYFVVGGTSANSTRIYSVSSTTDIFGGTNGTQAAFAVTNAGVIYARNTTIQSLSDIRLKENIRDCAEGLGIINALRPVRFDWKQGYGETDQLGFIAQEVEVVFPEAVSEWASIRVDDDETYKTVGPSALIPVLVKAIQELTARLEALENK